MDFFFLVAIIKIGETMKKKILLIMLPLFIIGILSVILIVNHKEKEPPKNITPSKENKEKKHCTPITGGSFNLIFNTNSDKTMENMTICIACAPDTYKDLPQAEKEEYIFEGWYYDKELTKKVEVTNTKDIQPIPIKDGDCTTGYEDINLYANYTKIEKKIEETPVIQSKTIQTQPENNNQIETPPQIEEQPSQEPVLYPTNFKRPPARVSVATEGGLFNWNNNYPITSRIYLFVYGSSVITALSNGELLAKFFLENNSGGIIITNEHLYNRDINKIENYIIVYVDSNNTNLNIYDSFTSGQVISTVHYYPNQTTRYYIYVYKDNENQIKEKILNCQNDYSCVKYMLTSANYNRINPMNLME